ncbi:MAG TPA: hypothetical protein VF701_07440 [Thermoanaerobaculia bacterium]
MFIAAAILVAAIGINPEVKPEAKKSVVAEPQVSCGIKTVGYRFTGEPGQQFRYAGATYVIPEEGWVEVVANKRQKNYLINGSTLPLVGGPHNQFGFLEVALPNPATKGEQTS